MMISRLLIALSLSTLAYAINGNSVIPAVDDYTYDDGGTPPTTLGDMDFSNGGKHADETSSSGGTAAWDYDAGSKVYERTPGSNSTPTLCFAKDGMGGYIWQLVSNSGDIISSGGMRT